LFKNAPLTLLWYLLLVLTVLTKLFYSANLDPFAHLLIMFNFAQQQQLLAHIHF
jgi:hypothetical protein